MIAILMNAILELRSRDVWNVIEAERWIRSDDSPDWPFSFNNICQALGIESSYMARGLFSWRARSMDAPRRVSRRLVRATRNRVVAARERPRPAITKPLQG